jgi:prepilin-type N-terminal cleavage/methylation domain-containing protein
MIFRFFKKLKYQNGFTLLELISGIGISAILGVCLISTNVTMKNTNDRNIARAMAVKEVENAVHYLNRDMQQAQKVELNGSDFWIKLSWTSWNDNILNQVTYNLDDDILFRQYSGSEPSSLLEIARYITNHTAAKPNPTPTPTTLPSEKTWKISVTSEYTSGNQTITETREIRVVPRPLY